MRQLGRCQLSPSPPTERPIPKLGIQDGSPTRDWIVTGIDSRFRDLGSTYCNMGRRRENPATRYPGLPNPLQGAICEVSQTSRRVRDTRAQMARSRSMLAVEASTRLCNTETTTRKRPHCSRTKRERGQRSRSGDRRH